MKIVFKEMPEGSSDEELLHRCAHRDERAWDSLVDRYRTLVYSVAFSWYGLDEPDASEVFQDVWLTVFERIESIVNPEKFRAWLIGIAVHKCQNLTRRSARRAQISATHALPGSAWTAEPDEDFLACEIIWEAVEEMGNPCRELLKRRYYSEETSYEEAARALGYSPRSVGRMQTRCLEHLHRRLARNGFFDAGNQAH